MDKEALAAAFSRAMEAVASEHWEAATRAIVEAQAIATKGVLESSSDGSDVARMATISQQWLLALNDAITSATGTIEDTGRVVVAAWMAGAMMAAISPVQSQSAEMLRGLAKGNQSRTRNRKRWQTRVEQWCERADWTRTNAALATSFRQEHANLAPASDALDKFIATLRPGNRPGFPENGR